LKRDIKYITVLLYIFGLFPGSLSLARGQGDSINLRYPIRENHGAVSPDEGPSSPLFLKDPSNVESRNQFLCIFGKDRAL
jgi:hypothetical protein